MNKALPTLAAVLMLAALWGAQAGAQETEEALEPGDVVTDGVAAVVVPPPGSGVVAHVITDSGIDEELMVSTSYSGEVSVDEMEDALEQAVSNDGDRPGTDRLKRRLQ